jgi:ribose transport system permease protein
MSIARINIVLIVLTAILVGAITGGLNAWLAEKMQTGVFVISIATNNIWYGFAYIMTNGIMLTGFGDDVKALAQTKVIGDIPSIGVVWIVCAIIASFILGSTRFGRHVYALGGNRGAAFLAGINVKKTNIMVHTLAGMFLGVGSLLLLSRSMSAIASSGSTYAFDCITACVLGGVMLGGGRGKVYQCVMGVLVVNVIFNGLTIFGINDFVRQVITGLVLVFAIAMEVLQRNAKVDLSDDTAGGRDAEKKNKKAVEAAK